MPSACGAGGRDDNCCGVDRIAASSGQEPPEANGRFTSICNRILKSAPPSRAPATRSARRRDHQVGIGVGGIRYDRPQERVALGQIMPYLESTCPDSCSAGCRLKWALQADPQFSGPLPVSNPAAIIGTRIGAHCRRTGVHCKHDDAAQAGRT